MKLKIVNISGYLSPHQCFKFSFSSSQLYAILCKLIPERKQVSEKMSFPASRLRLSCFTSPLCASLLNFSFHLEMSPFCMHKLRLISLSITSSVHAHAGNALSYSSFTLETYHVRDAVLYVCLGTRLGGRLSRNKEYIRIQACLPQTLY